MEVSPEFIRFAKTVLPDQPVIRDIGSRDALEGIYLFKTLAGKYLHVFEPNPAAAVVCRNNLEQLAGRDVYFNELAISDNIGELPFYPVNPRLSENKDVGFSSMFRVNPDYTKRRGSIVQDEAVVTSTTLDEYFAGKQAPDLLWIDAEGAELKVLLGAAHVLRSVSLIHIEVSFRPMQLGKPLFWEIDEYLKKHGFLFHRFIEISAFRSFLYRRHLLPNPPWRLNAVFYCSRRVCAGST